MRITVHESKDVGAQRMHQIDTTEQWSSLEEAVAQFETRLRELGKAWTVIRPQGIPAARYWVDIDVHDPPSETNISLIDADTYEKENGWSAEEFLKFSVKHRRLLEAIARADPRAKGALDQAGFRTIHELDVDWLADWGAIEERVRAHRVMRALVAKGDKVVRLRVWDVLIGVSGDARPVLVCEGVDQLMEARPLSVMVDTDTPWVVPYPVIHVAWKMLRQIVAQGYKVIIGEPLVAG